MRLLSRWLDDYADIGDDDVVVIVYADDQFNDARIAEETRSPQGSGPQHECELAARRLHTGLRGMVPGATRRCSLRWTIGERRRDNRDHRPFSVDVRALWQGRRTADHLRRSSAGPERDSTVVVAGSSLTKMA